MRPTNAPLSAVLLALMLAAGLTLPTAPATTRDHAVFQQLLPFRPDPIRRFIRAVGHFFGVITNGELEPPKP